MPTLTSNKCQELFKCRVGRSGARVMGADGREMNLEVQEVQRERQMSASAYLEGCSWSYLQS